MRLKSILNFTKYTFAFITTVMMNGKKVTPLFFITWMVFYKLQAYWQHIIHCKNFRYLFWIWNKKIRSF